MSYLQKHKWDNISDDITFTLEPDFASFEHHIIKDARILDYGCGYGRIADQLSQIGYTNVTGYDTSQAMIQRGQKDFPTLDIHSYEFPNLPCPDNSFDAAICCAVLTCIPDFDTQNTVIKELTRVLKPAAKLYICDFALNADIEYSQDGIFETNFGVKMKHFSKKEFLNLFKIFEQQFFAKRSAQSISGSLHFAYHYIGTNQ